MYQITGNTVSFRVSEDEKEILNELANTLQTDENTVYSNSKQLVFGLITKLNTDVNNVSDSVINDELQTLIDECHNVIGYDEIKTLPEILRDLLEIISTPLEPAPTVEIEKEVIKEVEKPLGENDILVQLEPLQKEVLEKIARFRVRYKLDDERTPLDVLIKRMIFNTGTLKNDHGAFVTGIK